MHATWPRAIEERKNSGTAVNYTYKDRVVNVSGDVGLVSGTYESSHTRTERAAVRYSSLFLRVSGAKESRPALDALVKDAKRSHASLDARGSFGKRSLI
jgi:hypothetical protein